MKAAKPGMKKSFWRSGLAKFLIIAILFATIMAAAGGYMVYYFLLRDLPSVDVLKDYRPSIATRVYADNNELIDEFYLEDRKLIHVKDVPKVVIDAFVASEDARFFQHKGFDPISMVRAFIKNLEAGKVIQGGSTITQQVAKAIYLSPERSYIRKIKEAVMAYKIDTYLSKEEILHLYLNHIYLGHGTYGVEAASSAYFGKSARFLTLPEAAILAGLPKAPTYYSPYLHYDRARQRQTYVLERMVESGFITEEQKKQALATPIVLRSNKPKDKVAPYFVEHVRRYIQEKYGSDVLYKEGLEVYTTLNIEMQKAARDAVERGLQELEKRQKFTPGEVQGALFCMEAKTGAVKSMVGGRDFSKSEFNRATQSRRQAGSAFKPFIYTAALDKEMTPSTVIDDSPVMYPDRSKPDGYWRPKNFDGKFSGPITLRRALILSRNVVTIKILEKIGIDYAAAYAANMGITSPLEKNLTMALGSSGVTLQEMVRGFGVLANQGRKVTPFFIKKIVDRTGLIFEENQPRVEQVIDPKIAFLANNIMQGVIQSGTGTRVKSIGRPAAGKTGTTNDMRDAWFIGFTPQLVTGVWIGFDQERYLGRQEVGGRAAAPIWLYFMEKAVRGMPVENFPVPEGIVFSKTSDGGAYEAYIEGTTPAGAAVKDSTTEKKPAKPASTEEDEDASF